MTLTNMFHKKICSIYAIENIKKAKNSEKVKQIHHHFLGRTNTGPAPITRKDWESSENASSEEDNVSESEEDIMIITPFLQIQVRQMRMTVMLKTMNIPLNSYLLLPVQLEPE